MSALPTLALASESPFRRGLRSLVHNPMAMTGAVIILAWTIIAIAAPVIAPYDALAQKIDERLSEPSPTHWFGTDEVGRDVFSRVIYGAQVSLPVGLIVVVFAMALGSLVGGLAGYNGGIVDLLVMRLVDITLAFPSIVLALAIAAALGPSLRNALIAMILVWWPEYARVMRGQVLSVKNEDYVLAARSIGIADHRIMLRHILPNSWTPLIVKASLDAGGAILTVAALSFIGLGAVPPTPEWGAMISLGRFRFYNWWLTTFPGLAVLTVVLGFNFLGDGLRDALDPRRSGLK
jgi:peptide/nickel transport system permease protein